MQKISKIVLIGLFCVVVAGSLLLVLTLVYSRQSDHSDSERLAIGRAWGIGTASDIARIIYVSCKESNCCKSNQEFARNIRNILDSSEFGRLANSREVEDFGVVIAPDLKAWCDDDQASLAPIVYVRISVRLDSGARSLEFIAYSDFTSRAAEELDAVDWIKSSEYKFAR